MVVFSAVIWSSTSFWSDSACATITAVRSARDRGRRGAVDALDQLDVVASDEVQREVALDADGELGQQVLDLLADGEQQVLLEDLRALRVGRLDVGDPRRSAASRCWRRYAYWRSRPMTAQRCDLLLLDARRCPGAARPGRGTGC